MGSVSSEARKKSASDLLSLSSLEEEKGRQVLRDVWREVMAGEALVSFWTQCRRRASMIDF